MSILIKGMEMPTSCVVCMFEQETGDGCECYINGCLTEYQKRPDDCPLVPVPAHGKMIIRDGVVIERDGSTDVRDYGKEIT